MGCLHFITCSCYHRHQILGTPARRDLLLTVTELMRGRYQFVIVGYVIVPEHIHLLISEPQTGTPSTVIQAIKLSFAQRLLQARVPHFSRLLREVGLSRTELPQPAPHYVWQRRFHDFNVWSQQKETEKLRYLHRNPVARGLVEKPEDWRWSSFQTYAYGETGIVRINDWSAWEEKIRLAAC